MGDKNSPAEAPAIRGWYLMLRDEASLLARPGAHHKSLLTHAQQLHREHLIDAENLSELLEFADAALLFAIESLLDIRADE